MADEEKSENGSAVEGSKTLGLPQSGDETCYGERGTKRALV